MFVSFQPFRIPLQYFGSWFDNDRFGFSIQYLFINKVSTDRLILKNRYLELCSSLGAVNLLIKVRAGRASFSHGSLAWCVTSVHVIE